MTHENIEKIWLTDTAVWIRTKDGREASERFDNYPWLSGTKRPSAEREDAIIAELKAIGTELQTITV